MQVKRYWILNPAAKVIAHSLDSQPDEWNFDSSGRYCVEHNQTKLSVWVANGWWFCAVYSPNKERLGLVGRTIVWMAFKRWHRSQPHALHPPENAAALNYLKGN